MIRMLFALLAFAPAPAGAHGAYHEVVCKLERLLDNNPDDADLHYRLATAHSDHEEWKLCLDELAVIERLKPGIHPTEYLRGRSLHQAGRHAEARHVLDAFIAKNPSHSGALATRGKVLMALGLPAEAAMDFRTVIQQTPTPGPEPYLQLADCLRAAGQSGDALAALDDGLEKMGAIPDLLRESLELATAVEDWDLALDRIAKLRESAPRPEPWMAERARLLTKAGCTPDARAAWSELREHMNALPNLDRGTPQNLALLTEAKTALGEPVTPPVAIPPASR